MAAKVHVFNDFSGGDTGRRRPDQVGNTFRGVNVWTYPSGIGPRPPFQDQGLTGLPALRLRTFHVVRGTDGFLYALFSFSTGAVYRVGAPGSGLAPSLGATLLGTLTNAPAAGANFGPSVYFVSTAGTGGMTDPVAGTATDIPALPAGSSIAQFGEQAVVAVSATLGAIRWSGLNDFTTWDLANTVNVGAAQTICALYPQRSTLVVPKLEGDIYSFTGVLGVNETLRRTDTGLRHRFPTEAPGAVVNQSSLWFCGTGEMGVFTGAQLTTEPRPDIPLRSGYDVSPWDTHLGAVAPLQEDDEFLLVGTMDKTGAATTKNLWAQAHRGGVWTRHIIPVTDYVVADTNQSRHTADAVRVNSVSHEGVAYVATTSTAAAASQVFAFHSRQEFPLVPNGVIYAPNYITNTLFDGKSGVPTVAEVAFEQWDPTGEQVTVRSVIVDFSYSPTHTPFSTYSKFDLSVEALQNAGSVAVRRSAVQTFTPAASGSTPDGAPIVRGQAKFQMGDQGSGVGFRIRLDDWRGIVVHRFTVVVDEAPVRP